MGGAAHLDGAEIGADLTVDGNRVHMVPRRHQWNSLGGDRRLGGTVTFTAQTNVPVGITTNTR